MFTRVSTKEKKAEVVKSFAEVGENLRVVIATSAFGMGIDCADIRKVIIGGCQQHWRNMYRSQVVVVEMGNHLKQYCFKEREANMLLLK